ncbi:ribonuclease p protein component [Nitritalea halalkaliphila LW7]|uniref:Ribonuclease p protein component n=1 Tax=Nitritalea halalkaliphila LW7 TaxID=1189621 RepID=I5BXN8_9BACT|nr:ribonuclease P protein component [Nitritalea halalkaliphila]EIM74340.1 ribonuclease p protein component [Nitritalea halalkaliphila LW7]
MIKGSSFFLYPFKVICLPAPEQEGHAVLFSIPKKKIRGAVERNLLKRRCREAYRLQVGEVLTGNIPQRIAFIYTERKVQPYALIEKRMRRCLEQIQERAAAQQASKA